MLIHIVKEHENLSLIAANYGITPRLLASLNGLGVYSPLAVGQALIVRFPNRSYTVRGGDTLAAIAAAYGTTVNALYRANPGLGGREDIAVGLPLVIDYTDLPPYNFFVGGYAYPFINRDVLDTSLPFMQTLIPFTYGFRADGSLYELNGTPLLTAARRYGTAAWMHLSTYTEGERFDAALAYALLSSEDTQRRLIENVLAKIKEKGYAGLDVDFEYIGAANAAPYAMFLGRVTAALNAEGYPVTAALAPKVRADQPGELYEGHDYRAVAEAVNSVLLMTYEWGYTYSAPMAVSPLPQVRRVVEYALTEMPADKILLGISNYGYKWQLPYNAENPVAAPSVSPAEATELAVLNKASILYDTEAEAPYFTYRADGKDYEVWFEDVRSLRARLALISEYGLKGALYWNLDRRNTPNLSLLAALNSYAET